MWLNFSASTLCEVEGATVHAVDSRHARLPFVSVGMQWAHMCKCHLRAGWVNRNARPRLPRRFAYARMTAGYVQHCHGVGHAMVAMGVVSGG